MQFEIVKYDIEYHGPRREPKIVISMVKAMEDDGKYLKFAKLEKVVEHLADHPVKFKPKDNGTPQKQVVDYENLPF